MKVSAVFSLSFLMAFPEFLAAQVANRDFGESLNAAKTQVSADQAVVQDKLAITGQDLKALTPIARQLHFPLGLLKLQISNYPILKGLDGKRDRSSAISQLKQDAAKYHRELVMNFLALPESDQDRQLIKKDSLCRLNNSGAEERDQTCFESERLSTAKTMAQMSAQSQTELGQRIEMLRMTAQSTAEYRAAELWKFLSRDIKPEQRVLKDVGPILLSRPTDPDGSAIYDLKAAAFSEWQKTGNFDWPANEQISDVLQFVDEHSQR